jgi:hypothetical protein
MMINVIRQPDAVCMEFDGGKVTAALQDGLWCAAGAAIAVCEDNGLKITLAGSEQPIRRVFLRWKQEFSGGRFFGDSGNGFLRINIGCPRAYITEGVKRLKKALEE